MKPENKVIVFSLLNIIQHFKATRSSNTVSEMFLQQHRIDKPSTGSRKGVSSGHLIFFVIGLMRQDVLSLSHMQVLLTYVHILTGPLVNKG